MADDFGSGVSRTLSAIQRAFQTVVWQKGKPPLDSEFNLMSQIQNEQMASYISASMHSGWLTDPTAAMMDLSTAATWSNFFKLGRQKTGEEAPVLWANVNGWMVPVTGTGVTGDDTSNRVNLNPPPDSDSRIDLVFLEVWKAQVAPNPSEANKPTSSTVWKYGNVEFGGTNITDDIEDPAIGFETTERVQVQYRIRVVGSGTGLGASVALDDFPDGLDDPNVLGQGASDAPQAGFTFTNMREELGDPGLWRAGTGAATNDLDTVDGYTYAVPICAVFRRNSQVFSAIQAAGNANQNGAFDRNPTATTLADPRTGAKALLTATLTNDITEATTGNVQIENLIGSGLDDTNLNFSSLFVVIDGEFIKINSVDTGASPGTMNIPATAGRGRNASMALPHAAGAEVAFYNARPDALFADEVAATDLYDLRRSVQTGDWDYQRLLVHNLSALVQGRLRSSWKQSGIGDTQGPYVVEVDTLLAAGTQPNQTEVLDGPDGIRQIFSDAATIQGDVTLLLAQDATQIAGVVAPGVFNATTTWDIEAGFQPGGFLTNDSGLTTSWDDGSVIDLYIGGSTGGQGARGTFRDSNERAVRFVSPREFWLSNEDRSRGLQNPVTLSFIEEPSMHPPTDGASATEHPGPLYPLQSTNFEKPFCVLGGLINSELNVGVPEVYNTPEEVRLPGLNFDVAGDWFSKTGGKFDNDPTAVSKPVLRGERTLWDMLTAGGTDLSGASSEVYLVLTEDTATVGNNGLYQVIGAGATAGFTSATATAVDRVRVRAVRPEGAAATFPATPGAVLRAQVRSQHTNAEDGSGGASLISAMQIVITDVAGVTGGASNPWNAANLTTDPLVNTAVTGRLAISTTLQYHPGRSGMARRPDEVWRFALVDPTGSTYLRQAPSAQDGTFPSQAGVPSNEVYFDINHIQTWNRLSSLGLHAPEAPAYGGEVVAFSEQDREAEAFFDAGSKTVMFRPHRNVQMTLKSIATGLSLFPATYNAAHGSGTIDGATLFTAAREVGFPLPPGVMPRFGRHDIPFNVDLNPVAAQPHFHQGINHLFVDDANNDAAQQFHIIGGEDNGGGGGGVLPMLFQTGAISTLPYGGHAAMAGSGRPAYQARLYEDITVQSSDVGRGMKGIQLPPYLGVARIYGVYDRRDFDLNSGVTFAGDRVTPQASSTTNLLRTDATKQTVFIVQGGASDVTEDPGGDPYDGSDDHTYVVPSDLIDIELSPSFVSGEVFEDLEYVVECVVFGFGRGFINKNNFVLLRRHSGDGTTFTDASDVLLGGVPSPNAPRMVVPTAALSGEQVSIGYSRTPYQGDPYMTRAGDSRTVSDYEARYGQVTQANAFELATPIQQFDSDGNSIVETPNRRALQVLASIDFYTTLGSGKIGGSLFPGTVTDVGYTQDTSEAAARVPDSSSQVRWRVDSRTFTEGQGVNPAHASLDLAIVVNPSGGETITISKGAIDTIFTAVVGAPTPPLEFEIGAGGVDAHADLLATTANLVATLNAAVSPVRSDLVAWNDSTATVTLAALVPGEEGRALQVVVSDSAVFAPRVGNTTTITSAHFRGGDDLVLNAGLGSSQLDLTGMTDRLPLGILLQDADFMCEDPLRNGFSSFASALGVIQPVQSTLPLTEGGEEFTRLVGGPGQWVGQADGGVLRYAAYTDATPTGSKRFRLFRGSSGFVMTEPNPGGPLDWVSGSFPAELLPVLKGGVLAGKALLVRNFVEDAFSTPSRVTHGSEIQMVILTRGLLGKGNLQDVGLTLAGILSPTGYGEGYAAADRYRLEGKPLSTGPRDSIDVDSIDLASFPFDISVEVVC